MSYGARRLLDHLKSYCRSKNVCWPSQERLAAKLERTTRTIQRWIAELRNLGLIEVIKRGHSSALIKLSPACFKPDIFVGSNVGSDVGFVGSVLITERKSLSTKNYRPFNPERKPPEKAENYILPGKEKALAEYLARQKAIYG